MQQTQHYKLNLIQPDDPFLPNPLNENTQKLDAALARVDAAVDDLGPRVTALEVHKVVIGTYNGTASDQVIEVGFTPKGVLVCRDELARSITFVVPEFPVYSNEKLQISVVENGFKLYGNQALNYGTSHYNFIAIT